MESGARLGAGAETVVRERESVAVLCGGEIVAV